MKDKVLLSYRVEGGEGEQARVSLRQRSHISTLPEQDVLTCQEGM